MILLPIDITNCSNMIITTTTTIIMIMNMVTIMVGGMVIIMVAMEGGMETEMETVVAIQISIAPTWKGGFASNGMVNLSIVEPY